eukprot:GFKZ01015252.1.p1 GENE.GFKZ01015252.1~~GFKZ01015252.1.p1  ORF type:complete len:191 (-),score=23.67 GFKZ01015252.1:962-1513(-)
MIKYPPLCPSRGPSRGRRRLAFASAAIAANAAVDARLPPPPVPLQSLGPTERVVEVALATTSNLLNGAIFGALFGFVSGMWSTKSLSGAFSEARNNGRSWGAISGVYAGLQTFAKVVRNREDRYNAVIGACGSGAAFTAKGGARAAVQGCVSFAALSYLIEMLAGGAVKDVGLSDEEILRKKR